MDSFFLPIDKPEGLTSQKVLSIFKSRFQFKKIGHHGTLDPFATGVLFVGVNEATKFFQFIDDSEKVYRARLKLGEKTDTLDKDGEILLKVDVPVLTRKKIESVLAGFIGDQVQIPPMYSAIKIGGKKLYELARKGEVVERPARPVKIQEIKLLEFDSDEILFETTVSRGTYIRVLGEDIAKALNTEGHLKELIRLKTAGLCLDECVEFESENCSTHGVSLETMFGHWPKENLNHDELVRLFHGKDLVLSIEHLEDLAVFYESRFVGIIGMVDGVWRSKRLVQPSLFGL